MTTRIDITRTLTSTKVPRTGCGDCNACDGVSSDEHWCDDLEASLRQTKKRTGPTNRDDETQHHLSVKVKTPFAMRLKRGITLWSRQTGNASNRSAFIRAAIVSYIAQLEADETE